MFNHPLLALAVLALLTGGCRKKDADGWRSKTVDDATWARWRFSETTDDDGEEVQFIEDETVTTAQASLEDAVALFLDVPGYIETFGNEESLLLETLGEDQWLIYESINNPWPVNDSDRVSELTLVRNEEEGSVSFNLFATPDAYPDQGLPRQSYFNVTYTFTDLGDGWLELHEEGEAIPPVHVPNWILRSAFPKVLFKSLRHIAETLEE